MSTSIEAASMSTGFDYEYSKTGLKLGTSILLEYYKSG